MRIFANYGISRDLPSSVNAALKQLAVPKQFCPGCGRQKHPDRFTGDRCNTCIKEMSVEKPVSTSTYEIGDSERKRQEDVVSGQQPDYVVKTPEVVADIGEALRRAHGWVGVLEDRLAGKSNTPPSADAAERVREEILQALIYIERVQRRLVQEGELEEGES